MYDNIVHGYRQTKPMEALAELALGMTRLTQYKVDY
jgi:hypothetical protein